MKHKVQAGDCVVRVAFENAVGDPARVWKHPDNAKLTKTKRTVDLLIPGDELALPAKEPATFKVAPLQTHKFIVTIPEKQLRVRLLRRGEPLASEAVTMSFDNGHPTFEGKTDTEGAFETKIPLTETAAHLAVADRRLHLKLGHLAAIPSTPNEDHIGVAQRLNALGYAVGSGAPESMTFRWAVWLFQSDRDIKASGELTDETLAKLAEAYGT